jgi:16S rRNA (cytidine1402-2'-O)-methyltransferase
MTARMSDGGRLVVVATPIGNLDDVAPRAARTLAEADLIAAEDTRRTGRLLQHLGVSSPMVAYHDHNEAEMTPRLVARMRGGETVALVSDAGTPGIADPGYRLIRAAVDAGIVVEAIPGPTAFVHALVVSGLPADRFAFEGFLPRKPGERDRRLAELAAEPRTLVFYVAPHRAAADLAAMRDAFGAERPAAVARELTKLHEEVIRGTLGVLAARAEEALRGELTVVVGGAPVDANVASPGELAGHVEELVAAGLPKKEAIAEAAARARVPKRTVYDAVLRRQRGTE